MPDRKDPKGRRTLVDALFDFIQGPEEDVREVPIDKVLKDLDKKGLDPAPLVKMMREGLRAAQAEENLRNAKAERERIMRLLAERTKHHYTGEDLRRRILEILGSNPQLAPAYRKFKEATDSDLESLLEDLNLLEGLGDADV